MSSRTSLLTYLVALLLVTHSALSFSLRYDAIIDPETPRIQSDELLLITRPVGESLAHLPIHIPKPVGKLTLYADFNGNVTGTVPVYVVNRTGQPFVLYAQDGDIFLKLEYEAAPGQWTRAQSHAFSWCGNSYIPSPVLANDSFLVVRGYAPREGISTSVRYSLYGQSIRVASNQAVGWVREQDIAIAATDALAVQTGSFEFVRRIAVGETVTTNKLDHIDIRSAAIVRLSHSDFDAVEAEKVLQRISEEKNEQYARDAIYALNLMRSRQQPSK